MRVVSICFDEQMPHVQINWPQPPADWSPNWYGNCHPAPNIHVWGTSLAPSAKVLKTLMRILVPSELERAARFRFERDRNHFVAGRIFLRSILALYLCTEPSRLQFNYSTRGKPVLGGVFANTNLHFSLAHSEDLGLLAVSPVGAVGIDVERVRPLNEINKLVDSVFSHRESAAFREMPENAKQSAFFRLWVRKEAFLKATGEGISQLLDQVEVSFLPGESAQLVNIPSQLGQTTDWHLCDLAPAFGFAAALAAPFGTTAPICCRWTTFSS